MAGTSNSGRRTILTPEIIKQAVALISVGNYACTVAAYLGIHQSTWFNWLAKGEKARDGIYKEFVDAIKKAEAVPEIRAVTGIVDAAKENWQAWAWFLERKHKDRWGRYEKINQEITGKDGAPLTIPEIVVNFVSPKDEEKC